MSSYSPLASLEECRPSPDLLSSAQEERNIYGHSGRRFKMTKGVIESDASMKLKEMDEKNMHNLFLKNMAGLIEETKNPSPCNNP